MIYKPCKYKGCATSPRCAHLYWIQVQHKGDKERGPITNYLWLWTRFHPQQPAPTTKDELKQLESYVLTWVAGGRTQQPPTPSAPSAPTDPPAPGAPPTTIGEAADIYMEKHVKKLACKVAPTATRRIKKAVGDQPLPMLLDAALLRDFLDDIEDDSSTVNRNRHLTRWSHLLTWCREAFGLVGASPFRHVQLNPKGVAKIKERHRTQRINRQMEAALIRGFKLLKDGGMMLGRFYCALDAGLRRGEMLQLRRADVLRNYQGVKGRTVLHVRWMTSKTREERFVPVATKRLQKFLDGRRFQDFPFGQFDGTRVDSFRQDWEAALLLSGLEAGEWSEQKTTEKGGRYRQWMRTLDANLHWHDIRHECGSRYAERAVPLHEIQKLLGHSSLATTQKYLNAELPSLHANMKKAAAGL